MIPWEIALLVLMGYALIGMALYAVIYSNTNTDHLRSFTPICPNCGLHIRATRLTVPNPRRRLRDHFKECEA